MASEPAGVGWHTAHEFVRESLRRAILRGDLGGGERLIKADLARKLRVSTTPVREAMRDLATEGLITLDRHRSVTVRGLNWDDMQEIRMLRESLEPLGVDLAIARVTEATLHAAEALCDRMTRESDPADWAELNRRFHFLFHDSTGAPRLAAILRGLEEAATLYVAQAQRLRPEIRRRANAAHRAFIDACRHGDHEAAQRAMAGHAGMSVQTAGPGDRSASG
jgi:DNA-binding GntR family transcriptional regulator